MNGKILIAMMLAAALAAMVVHVAFQRLASGRAVAFWGVEAARLAKQGRQVRVLRLGPPMTVNAPGDAPALEAAGRMLEILEQQDASGAPGLLHMRNGLMTDVSYDWDADAAEPPAPWRYAMQFSDGDEGAPFTVLLTEDCLHVAPLRGQPVLRLKVTDAGSKHPGVSPLLAFIEEQFGDAKAASP